MTIYSTIILISPQRWHGFKVSKHYYALELMERGHTVYFLEPPERKYTFRIRIERVFPQRQLFIIKHGLLTPYFFRFHLLRWYQLVNAWQTQKIRKLIGKVDIVWDFDNIGFFPSTRPFNAALNIFHPVDVFGEKHQNIDPDIIFSVSPEIIRLCNVFGAPKHFINHGLSSSYATYARQRKDYLKRLKQSGLSSPGQGEGNAKVAYIGNLDHLAIDWDFLYQVVISYPKLMFIFFGPYTLKPDENNLKKQVLAASNVTLRGFVDPNEILKEVHEIDLFLLCYKRTAGYKMDNSHKILEYLSTGKAVVSSHLSVYSNSDLIRMPKQDDPDALFHVFEEALRQLKEYNSIDRQIQRIEFVLDHTYKRQVDRIFTMIGESSSNALS